MKPRIEHLSFLPVLIAGLGLSLAVQATAQPCTFGPEVQSENTAGISYDPETGTFQFTNAPYSSEEFAYLPLTGAAAGFIATTNDWTSSLAVFIPPRTMDLTFGDAAHVVMGLVFGPAIPNTGVFIFAAQDNNTGGGDDAIYPHGWYGTAIRFGAVTNGVVDVVTPLGNSLTSGNGSVYRQLTGATNALPATESFGTVAGVVTLSYNASANTVTAFFNGIPVGSNSLAGWGFNPPLTLALWGGSGAGDYVALGTDAGRDFFAGPLPVLSIVRSGANVILTWPTNCTAFTLQSTTNLVSPVWTTNSPEPVVVNGQNAVTNPIIGAQRFFRLSQ